MSEVSQYRFQPGDRVVLLWVSGHPHGEVLTQHRDGFQRWYGVMVDIGKDKVYYTPYEGALWPENPLESLAAVLRDI